MNGLQTLNPAKVRTLGKGEVASSILAGGTTTRMDCEWRVPRPIRVKRLNERVDTVLHRERLAERKSVVENELKQALEDGSWRSHFRGRDILRRFAGNHLSGLPYEAFRDAIVARMADAGRRPVGMKEVVDRILADTGV